MGEGPNLRADRISFDLHAAPEELCVWVGPDGARAIRAKDAGGFYSFIDPEKLVYPGFHGNMGVGFFVPRCRLLFDHADVAPADQLIKAGQIVVAEEKISLVVTEGPFRHLTFVGLVGESFTDGLHHKVKNAIILLKWQIGFDQDDDFIVLCRSPLLRQGLT